MLTRFPMTNFASTVASTVARHVLSLRHRSNISRNLAWARNLISTRHRDNNETTPRRRKSCQRESCILCLFSCSDTDGFVPSKDSVAAICLVSVSCRRRVCGFLVLPLLLALLTVCSATRSWLIFFFLLWE